MSTGNHCPDPHRRSFLSSGLGLVAGAGLASTAVFSSCASSAREEDRLAGLDEQLGALTDRSHEVKPIDGEERAARRLRLGQQLAAAGFDAMLIEPCATMEYLCGVQWGHSERLFALVLLADGSHFWICPAFEEEKAKLKTTGAGKPGGDIVTWDEHVYAYAPLHSELRSRGALRLCVEPSIRYLFVAGLAQEMKQAPAPAARSIITELRGRKDAHELQLLRKANELTQLAIAMASQCIRPGMTGREMGALVKRAHERLGLVDHWDLSLVGAAAAYPHGEARDIRIKPGDMLLIDTGGALHGYQSDNTRSWIFDGQPTEHQTRVWNGVRDAQRAAFEAIRPGVRAGEIDLVARRWLERAGLTDGYSTFSHRLGHGIGMEGHEDPYFDSGSQVILAPGMTLSVEPGIYLYGKFGVRLEDIIAVSAEGAENFGDWQATPLAPN